MRSITLAVAAATAVTSASAMAADTQSVFTTTDGDTIRFSRKYNPDPEPSFYTTSFIIDQATGVFAPFASSPSSSDAGFAASNTGRGQIQFGIDAYQPGNLVYILDFTPLPSSINYNYTNVFCENSITTTNSSQTCFTPDQNLQAEVSYYLDEGSGNPQRFFSQQVTGVVVSSLFMPSPSSTPEPESWAMMIAGFGLVGGAIRYRRKSVTFT